MEELKCPIKEISKIIEFIPSPIAILDFRGKILTINNEVYNLFGYTINELSNFDLVAQNIFKDVDYCRSIFNQLLNDIKNLKTRKIKPLPQLAILYNKKQEELFIQIDFNILKNYVYVTLKNFTKLKKTEKELKEKLEIYNMIYENSPVAIFRTSFDGKIIYSNLAAKHILEYDEKDNIQDFIKNLSEDFYADPEDRKKILEKIFTTKSIIKETVKAKTKNGNIIYCKLILKPFFKDSGELKYIEGIFEDVSAKEKMQKALIERKKLIDAIIDNLPFEIWVVDKKETIILQNKTSIANWGVQKGNTITCLKLSEKTLKRIRNENDEIFKGKTINKEEEIIDIDGKKKHFVKIILPIFENNTVTSVLRIYIDVTKEKNIEKKILNAVINAEESSKSTFSQELHDGLGPLLSTVKLYLEWLSKPDVKQDKTKIIEKIKTTINEAYTTVREISYKLSPHILKNFGLISAIKAFTSRINETNILKINLVDNLEDRLPKIHEIIVYRAICELINNTLKHAEATKIDIEIERTKNFLSINFQDDGKGFDIKEKISKGIGLENINNRLKSINGVMEIDSKINEGTKIDMFIVLE